MKFLVAFTFVVSILFGGCRSKSDLSTPVASSRPMPPADSPTVRIWVAATGEVELDGKLVEIGAAAPALADLAARKGVVLYGRDLPSSEPHPNGMKIIKLVVEARLPIRLCKRRDFSDATGPDGKVRD